MKSFIRGMIIPLEGVGSSIEFQWNPQELNGPDATAGWEAISTAGREKPYLHYTSGEVRPITFTLKLSRFDKGADFVKQQMRALIDLTKTIVRGAGVHRPPKVKLVLGTFRRVTCVVKSVTTRANGHFEPATLEAAFGEVSVTLWEWPDE